jgi:hypothetical protein
MGGDVAGFGDGNAASFIDQRELLGLLLRVALQLLGFLRDLMLELSAAIVNRLLQV